MTSFSVAFLVQLSVATIGLWSLLQSAPRVAFELCNRVAESLIGGDIVNLVPGTIYWTLPCVQMSLMMLKQCVYYNLGMC